MHKKSSNRSFGILFFFVFLGFGLWPLTKDQPINFILIFISTIFLILGVFYSKLLGRIVAPIVMALVYFVILTPISLLVRIFGKDLLGLKFLKKQNSYWIKRSKDLGKMDKQF